MLTDWRKIVGFLAAGLVMTTSAVSTLIYQNSGTMQAAAAGFILLSMISVSQSLPRFMHRMSNIQSDHLDILFWLGATSKSQAIC